MTTGEPTRRNIIWKTLLPVGVIVLGVVASLMIMGRVKVSPHTDAPHSSASAPAAPADLNIGSTLPDFGIHKYGEATNSSTKVSELKGKVVMINFWATWCEACMVEMPSIVELNRSYKDQGFELISINLDDDPEKVLPRALKTFKMDFTIYTDNDSKLADIFDIHAIPLTIIMSHDRKILMIERGEFDWNGEAFHSRLKDWLSG